MRRVLTGSAVALAASGVLAAAGFGAGTTHRIAFVKSSARSVSVWIANGNGADPHKLGAGALALISPNGRYVAATNETAKRNGLIVYRASGGKLIGLPPLPALVTPLAFSPDSTLLAVSVPSTQSGSGAGNAKLDVIDLATGTVAASVAGLIDGASFAPTGHSVAFGMTKSLKLGAKEDLYSLTIGDSSATIRRLTTNGDSLDPVWGSRGIVFTEARSRGVSKAPAYHLAVLRGGKITSIASPKPGPLVSGLTPVAISANGRHLVAEFVGEDTSIAYAVDLAHNRYRLLGASLQGFGISRDGSQVLVSYGGFEGPSTHATIATVPFGGGHPHALITGGDEPSWNR